eukprot:Plantae.Rhodophyta-Purpureofilum_apyrenoidigerum.ctg7999.p1 GENE.Plantae.Rhodophyta-Purpureofilum_apyrenoidigerum.ctg7999~~Plantae.Rhodophyta-Purpureofilum_apyrenoidigerum.ctg7999.p1  ORF type:complete len:266 (+),score=55.22 Plantae.Rhodophyta-Purpureofilum_apyrenoidigerum.ctg7999:171-968(+)
MESLRTTLSELENLMSQESPDLKRCRDLVTKLKVGLVNLPEMSSGAILNETSADVLLIARQTYEKAAGLSILCEDTQGFYRNVALLKDYYLDYAQLLPESKSRDLIIGLHLLLLLAQNRIAEFHTELELVPEESRQDQYIKFPIRLEQFLTEGSYAKLTAAKDHIPEKSFAFFMELLMGTVRDEIARSSESAYEELPYSEAQRILDVETVEELENYAARQGWKYDGSIIRFTHKEETPEEESIEQSVLETIERSLQYAVELERIV